MAQKPDPNAQAASDESAVSPASPRTKILRCPKCAAAMQPVEHAGVEVDRCTACRGLWFDLLEHEDLKKLKGAEGLDFGDASVGKKANKIDQIKCPVCQADMVRLVDPQQKHIWLEACAKCYGVYFDAGEFRDWKEQGAVDWLKSLITRERR